MLSTPELQCFILSHLVPESWPPAVNRKCQMIDVRLFMSVGLTRAMGVSCCYEERMDLDHLWKSLPVSAIMVLLRWLSYCWYSAQNESSSFRSVFRSGFHSASSLGRKKDKGELHIFVTVYKISFSGN